MASSLLPWKWVIESLAGMPDAGTSVLSALLQAFPGVLVESSSSIKERVALRYLDEFAGTVCEETTPPLPTNDASMSSYVVGLNSAQTCEEVLRSKILLREDSSANGCMDGKSELLGGDLHQFILLKRATLPKPSIELLKEQVLGSDHFSLNCHRDHRGKKKIKKNMKFANFRLNRLAITRKYSRLKNRANKFTRSNGVILEKSSYSARQGLAKDYVEDDKKSNEGNLDNDQNKIQPLIMKEIEAKHISERSAGFHDAKMQCLRDISACHDNAPNNARDNMKTSLPSEQQFQGHTVLHVDSSDFHGEVLGMSDDDVKMLQESSMPRSSPVQGLCVKCGKSGQLLICCGDNCSRAIHESCLGSRARYAKDGLFYCHFCTYENAFVIYKKAKKKALKARRSLFKLYGGGPEVYVLKRRKPSAKFKINHNGNKKPNLSSNQQSTNSSNEKRHNGILIEEENLTRFSDVDHQEITENKLNLLNGSVDTICKNLHPCRESIECHAHVVGQDMPLNLQGETDANHVLRTEVEDPQPVEGHALPADGILPVETLQGCSEHLQVEQGRSVHTDVDRERSSVQPNRSSSLMVEQENEYADVVNQGPLYMLADLSSALLMEMENKHADVANQEQLYMLANISSILLMEEENMHADAVDQERPSQANKISAMKMDVENAHPPLNLQGETGAYHGLMRETEQQQHVKGHALIVDDSVSSEICTSGNRTDDQRKSFESEVCSEILLEHRQNVHADALENQSSTFIVEEENFNANVTDQEPLSMQANRSSTLVMEEVNVHADVADQEWPYLVHKNSVLEMDDECGHHPLNLLGDTDAYHELTRGTKDKQSLEGHALIVDDSLPLDMYVSCNRVDNNENVFESEVCRENLQFEHTGKVVGVVDGEKFLSALANRGSIFIVEEEKMHADVDVQESTSMQSKKNTLVVEEENVHDVTDQARPQSIKSSAMTVDDECNHHPLFLKGETDAYHELTREKEYSQPVKDCALNADDSLPDEMSCIRRDDCKNIFVSKVVKEHLQNAQRENVHVDVHDQGLPLKYANKSTSFVVEEENVHADFGNQEPLSIQGNKNSTVMAEEENVHADVSDQEQPSQPIKSSALKMDNECGHGAKRKALASQIKERFSTRNRRHAETSKSDVCWVTVKSLQTDGSFQSNVRRCVARKKRSSRPPWRRAKCFWKPEEEKLLEEILQKAWNMDEGRISWKKILEDGRHVFHGNRTPADLKDKWRGMQRKEATASKD